MPWGLGGAFGKTFDYFHSFSSFSKKVFSLPQKKFFRLEDTHCVEKESISLFPGQDCLSGWRLWQWVTSSELQHSKHHCRRSRRFPSGCLWDCLRLPDPCRNPPFCFCCLREGCIEGELPKLCFCVWLPFYSSWIPFGDHPLKLERYRED